MKQKSFRIQVAIARKRYKVDWHDNNWGRIGPEHTLNRKKLFVPPLRWLVTLQEEHVSVINNTDSDIMFEP